MGQDEPILSYEDVSGSMTRREYATMLTSLVGTAGLAGCSSDSGSDSGGDGDSEGDGGADTAAAGDTATSTGTDNGGPLAGPRPHFDAYSEVDAQTGGTVVTVMSTSYTSLDQLFTINTADIAIANLIAERLFELNEELEVYPKIATDVEVNDGGREWVFPIREGVMFHPPYKRELTAEDVIYNIERAGNPDVGAPRYKEWNSEGTFEAVDDYTVRMSFDKAYAGMDNWQASIEGIGMHSPDAIEEHGDMKQQPVGTGPFVFEEWTQGDRARFSAFDDYYIDGLPFVDELVTRVIPNASTRRSALQNNEVQILQQPVSDTVRQLESASDVTVSSTVSDGFRTVDVNPMDTPTEGRSEQLPTTDQKVRDAINAALGREELTALVWDGRAKATQNYWPENSPWHVDYNPYSMTAEPEQAQQLIEEAGYDTPLDVSLLSASGRPELNAIGQVVRDQLTNGGFNVDLRESESWWTELQSAQWDLAINIFSGIPEPAIARNYFTEAGTPIEDMYAFNWTVPDAEEMFDNWDEANQSTDYEERKNLMDEVQRAAIDAGTRNALVHPHNIKIHRNEVKNYKAPTHAPNFEMDKLWLE